MKNLQDSIRQGKILLIPFDTVWGLAGDARDRGVVEKIFEIKGRDKNKPVSILLPRLDYFSDIYQEERAGEKGKYLPGPVTLLIKIKQKPNIANLCFSRVIPRNGSDEESHFIIGIRYLDPTCQIQKIASQLDIPLTATSANRAGERETRNLAEAKAFLEKIPEKLREDILLVDTKEKISGQSSKIIDLTGPQPKEYTRNLPQS